MAKLSKPSKAQQRATDLTKRRQMAEWQLSGRSKELAAKYGIMADMFPGELSALEKEHYQAEKKAVSEEVVALQDKAVALWKKDESTAKELGTLLLQIKAIVGHGAFTKWFTKAGLEQNRVSYCVRLAAPEGNKVQAANERVKKSPRARALRTVLKKLAALYDVAEAGEREKAKELLKEITEMINEKFMPKAKATAA